jgi:Carbohydrate binding domain
MRKWTALCTMGLVSILPALAAADHVKPADVPNNVDSAVFASLPNADMEEGGTEPAQWSVRQKEKSTGEGSWDIQNTHSGKRAYRLRKENAEGYLILDSAPMTVEPGKEYEVSAWVRLHQASKASIYLMVTQYSPGSKNPQPPNAFTDARRSHRAGEWERLSIRVSVREPNTLIRVHGLMARDAAEVTWDDFSVQPAPSR